MAIQQEEQARDCIPDPAALAQGHRLHRIASSLELPGWSCGIVALAIGGLLCLLRGEPMQHAICVVVLAGVVWLLWAGRQTAQVRSTASCKSTLPAKVHDLLTLVDGLIDALERGNDRVFNLESLELLVALEGLGAEGSRYLDERGADCARLRHGVACLDASVDASARISPDRRRALHVELRRFVAAARGRPCGDPYRSQIGDRPALLAVVRDPELRRTRWAHAGLLAVLAVIWALASQGIALLRSSWSWSGWGPTLRSIAARGRLCNPWGDNPNCGLIVRRYFGDLKEVPRWLASLEFREFLDIEPSVLCLSAIALLPMFLLLAASASRKAGWRSWAAALPCTDSWPDDPSDSKLGRARRRQQFANHCGRALAWLVGASIVVVLLASHDWRSVISRAIIVELFTLGVLVISTVIARLERGRDRRRSKRRVERAGDRAVLLADLSGLRREFEDSESMRGELLEQLADLLAGAETLGALSPGDRDCVVERLRLGAARGWALARQQRELLSLDLRACEALIGSSK